MKVLFISSWFPNKLEPTNGNFVQRHAEAVALLHDVEILHAIGDFNQTEKFIFDDKIINGIRTLIVYYKNSNNQAQNFLRRIKAYKIGFSKLKKPDLVHANIMHNNMLFAVYLKRKYGIPFVITEHWSGFLKENINQLSFFKKIIAKKIGKAASYILPVSQNIIEGLNSIAISNNYCLINNVVDTDVFKVSNNVLRDKISFLHVSNLIKIKNPQIILNTIIKLIKEGYDIHLSIGGDGDTTSLYKIVEDENMQHCITIFGEIDHRVVAEKMMDSDYFILFSSYENQPCVLIESLACGKPVVAPRVGGIPEFIKEGMGSLVAVNNSEDLYITLKRILDGKIQFKSSTEIREYAVDNFSKSAISKKIDTIYNLIKS